MTGEGLDMKPGEYEGQTVRTSRGLVFEWNGWGWVWLSEQS